MLPAQTGSSQLRQTLDIVALVGVASLPLACNPAMADAFSTPKLWVLGALDLWLLGLILWKRPQAASADWLTPAWVLALSVSTLTAGNASLRALGLAMLPLPAYWAIRRGALRAGSLAEAIRLGSLAESLVAVLQWCGADPFRMLGWQPETLANSRMRVYGTLGNPDFVAAWCCATLPLACVALCHRRNHRLMGILDRVGVLLQIAAILATGSRVLLLFLPVYAALVVLYRPRWWRVPLLAIPLALALVWLSPARPLATTLAGRLYLARIPAAHWREVPPAGYGAGSFEMRFALWQVEWAKTRGVDRNVLRFAGPVDHAHNDYLEFFVEYGPLGLCAFLAVCGRALRHAWRLRSLADSTSIAGSAGAAAGLIVAATVDFPFHRPAEWGLLWLCFGLLAAYYVGPSDGGEFRVETRSVKED